MNQRIPVIDCTDLYHPHQDVGDNFDLVLPYALNEEIDLRAIVLDCTERFRQARTDHPNPHYRDEHGPRDPGFVSVLQLNYIFGRNVPAAVGPFLPLRSPDDASTDAPAFQQQGVELILRTLRESDVPVDIAIFCSSRAVTAAFNRDPELFRRKVRRIHLSAGGYPRGYLEWNVMLDPHAFVGLLRSGLPIDIYPCATHQGPFDLGTNNSFWSMPDLRWIENMEPSLRRYLGFALQRVARMDYLRAMEEDWPALSAPEAFRTLTGWEHKVWETAVWQNITGRKLVRRADGSCRILRLEELRADDGVVPEEMIPVDVKVSDDGHFDATPTSQPTAFRLYHRPDPAANQAALRDALPALYLSFRSRSSGHVGLQPTRAKP
jgi:hypothetical protein